MKPLYIAKGDKERRMERDLLHPNDPENKTLIKPALTKNRR
jgi:hypothetical protein